jgi:tetratricopeptide (TPR) repeat protein
MEKENSKKTPYKSSREWFSRSNRISTLGIAIAFLFAPIKWFSQVTTIVQNQKNDLVSNINTQIMLDTMDLNVLLERFEYNTFIKVKVLERNEYLWLQEKFVQQDSGNILYIPEDVGIKEFEDIIFSLNQKTFWSNMPEHAAFLKIKKMKSADKNWYYQMLLESIFEYGTDSLSNINNLKNTFVHENKLLEDDLRKSKASGDKKEISKIQKKIIINLMSYIHNFWRKKTQKHDIFDIWVRNKKWTPTHAIENNISNCITKSIIAYKILEYYGIQNQWCYSTAHQSIKVILADQSSYYFDAERFDEIIPWKENEKLNTNLYRNIKTSRWAINTITQNTESMIIANMLYNSALVLHQENTIEKDASKKEEKFKKSEFYLQKALLFTDSIPLFWKLWAEIYYYKAQNTINSDEKDVAYQKAIEYIDHAIQLDDANLIFWEIKWEVLKKMGRYEESKHAYEKFKKLMLIPVKK